jgi:hypothetical protein
LTTSARRGSDATFRRSSWSDAVTSRKTSRTSRSATTSASWRSRSRRKPFQVFVLANLNQRMHSWTPPHPKFGNKCKHLWERMQGVHTMYVTFLAILQCEHVQFYIFYNFITFSLCSTPKQMPALVFEWKELPWQCGQVVSSLTAELWVREIPTRVNVEDCSFI